MPYKVGISSGWWHIDRPPELLGLATKVGSFGGTVGCQFIQADLETTSEFFEPRLKTNLMRAKKELGLEVGLHAEIGELMALESAERRLWDQSHLRLLETIKNAADFGMIYVLVHTSNRPQLMFLEAQYRVTGYFYPVVSFDGQPLYTACEKNENVKKAAKRHLRGVESVILHDNEEGYNEYLRWRAEIEKEEINKQYAELNKNEMYRALKKAGDPRADAMEAQARQTGESNAVNIVQQNLPEIIYDIWKKAPNAKYSMDTAEIAAYMIIARYMKETGDPLWTTIAKDRDVDDCYVNHHAEFNAAVAAKYLEGHLIADKHPYNKQVFGKEMSLLEFLNKNNVLFLLEIPEAHAGNEGLLRLFNPLDTYILLKKLNNPKIKLCVDFEHMISHKLDVDEVIKKMPRDFGKSVFLFHLGKPIPYFGTAHPTIPIGSRSQEIIYKWLYEMRKSGFQDGYMIYERGGGKTPLEVTQNSVWAMRQIANFLDKDINPEDLPPEFYGVSEQNREVFARQSVAIHDHAWDPLEGVLSIPEEKHGHFSKASVEKGKGEVWEKRKYR